jgi:protocatechuate 3,4-dioxygenase beta subunit
MVAWLHETRRPFVEEHIMTRPRDFFVDPRGGYATGAGRLKVVTRREALSLLGVSGAALALTGCGETPTNPTLMTMTSPAESAAAACAVTPAETVGPFPSRTELFRSDIRDGRSGTPLMLRIRVVNVSALCAAVIQANVELWQCDAAGNYSQYGAQTGQTFLRGIQTTDGDGEVGFRSIYPGWYQGRATHIHLEVMLNGVALKATQIAFPESVNADVYGSGVYAPRGINPTSNVADSIFADSLNSQLVTPTGDPVNGYTAAFEMGVTI